MTNVSEVAPEWFYNLLSQVFQEGDHDTLESLLGIGRVLVEGKNEEARGMALMLYRRLSVHRQIGAPGEQGSTQLLSMLNDGTYPEDLCVRIKNRMELK